MYTTGQNLDKILPSSFIRYLDFIKYVSNLFSNKIFHFNTTVISCSKHLRCKNK